MGGSYASPALEKEDQAEGDASSVSTARLSNGDGRRMAPRRSLRRWIKGGGGRARWACPVVCVPAELALSAECVNSSVGTVSSGPLLPKPDASSLPSEACYQGTGSLAESAAKDEGNQVLANTPVVPTATDFRAMRGRQRKS